MPSRPPTVAAVPSPRHERGVIGPGRRKIAALCVLALSAAGVAASPPRATAQEQGGQDRKLIDRILRPDMSLSNPVQNKSFNGGKSFAAGKASAPRPFWFVNKTNPHRFVSGSFWGAKGFWGGGSQYATAPASTATKFAPFDSDRTVATKTKSVEAAYDAGRTYRTRPQETRPFLNQGKTQKELDAQQAARKPLSIDEIRELLNKNE